jgi:type II secretory pathway predicted ATPase ExeA
MFEQHFGLSKTPFDALAAGEDVFVGPQAATLVRRAKTVFTNPDSVLCVSGPVGSGKTTLVGRALSALGRQHTVIRIGRIKLGPDEVLDYMLRELGLKKMPAGTIQKITVFRNILEKLESNDIRLFVIVEDATRLGNIALQELEALTATDSGVSDGANLVLMAEAPLALALEAPGLKRLKQRARLHSTLQPMNAAETRGYVNHAIRRAGGEPENVVTDEAIASAQMVSEGIPRILNNVLTSALESAADNGLQRLDADELLRVAAEDYGIEIDVAAAGPGNEQSAVDLPQSDTATDQDESDEPAHEGALCADESAPEAEIEETTHDVLPELAAIDTGEHPIPALIQDTLPNLEVLAPETAEQAVSEATHNPDTDDMLSSGAGTENAETEPDEALIPIAETDEPAANAELSPEQRTTAPDVDDLPVLEPEPATADFDELPLLPLGNEHAATAVTNEEVPTLKAEPDAEGDDREPTLIDSSGADRAPSIEEGHTDSEPATSPDDRPAWERDPTLAELRPDLQALERAMALAQSSAEQQPRKLEPEPAVENVEEVPDITLDDSIRRKIEIAEAALQVSESLNDDDIDTEVDVDIDVEVPPAPAEDEPPSLTATTEEPGDTSKKADPEIDRIANELARAKTIEDVDDKLAETLFGEEFSMIAAEVAASIPIVDDDQDPAEEATDAVTPLELHLDETAENVACEDAANSHMDIADHTAKDTDNLERKFHDPRTADALQVSMETTPNGLNMSATQRLATVRALNAATAPAANGSLAKPVSKSKAGPVPEPIEKQINVSITQTLQSLDPATIKQMQEAEAENEEKKGGLFKRFRRTRSS